LAVWVVGVSFLPALRSCGVTVASLSRLAVVLPRKPVEVFEDPELALSVKMTSSTGAISNGITIVYPNHPNHQTQHRPRTHLDVE
jgi:hypothetical protein